MSSSPLCRRTVPPLALAGLAACTGQTTISVVPTATAMICRRPTLRLIGACLSVALLAACSGGNNGLPTSTPISVTPSQRSQPALSQPGMRKNVQTESVLYSFAGGKDGVFPFAGVTNVGGTLYGTTQQGGASNLGTVFESTSSGAESVLYSFAGGSDGDAPNAGLTDVSGTLYGTTRYGGASNLGTVFKITTSGAYAQLYSFAGGGDGEYPVAGLTNVGSTLYGTTEFGGASNLGTVFKIKCRIASCTGSVLYSFAGGSDGEYPVAGLTNVRGALYGTTSGGASGAGTVFKVTTSGAESVLHSFAGGSDGETPAAALTNVSGTLYGTTEVGGASNRGTVFKTTTSGAYVQLYSFAGGSDGEYPAAGLMDVGGTLYGTTTDGGSSDEGTIFALAHKSGPELVLYSFTGGIDGEYPRAGLTNVGGTLYGTTEAGGASGIGTIFSLSL